ncbi:DUF5305 domain-containing protein [Stygiolobus caldivivus]|nr:DUF5305 domain-containing protein [Stygiolobus caldivivus]
MNSQKLFQGYETLAYVDFFTSALIKPNPFIKGQNITVYMLKKTQKDFNVIPCVILNENYSKLLGISKLKGISTVPTYLAKEIVLNLTSLRNFSYAVIISDEGVYNTTLYSGVSNSSYLTLNVSEIARVINNLSSYIPGSYSVLIKITHENITTYFPINYDGNAFQIPTSGSLDIPQYLRVPYNLINVSQASYPLSLVQQYCVHFYVYPSSSAEEADYSIIVNTTVGTWVYNEGISKGIVSLNISSLYNTINNLLVKYGLYSSQYAVIINFTIKTKNYTLYPFVVINNNNGILSFSAYNTTLNMTVYADSPEKYSPLDLAYLIIPASALFFIFGFTRPKTPSEMDKVLSKLKKVNKLTIEVNSKPEAKKVVEVKDINDIIKFSVTAVKPVLVYKDKGILQIWIVDNDVGYVYTVSE